MMSLYDYFFLNPVTHTFRNVLNICYSNNIRAWITIYVCWNYDRVLLWKLLPITSSAVLNGANILLLNN